MARKVRARLLTVLGQNHAGGGDHDGPLELGLEVLNHLVGNFGVESEGAEGDADQDVLAKGAVGLLVLNPFSGLDEHETGVVLEVGVGLFELDEGLGSLFFELGNFSLQG